MKREDRFTQVERENSQTDFMGNFNDREYNFGTLLSNTQACFAILSAKGEFLYLTPAASNFLGYRVNQVSKTTFFELIDTKDCSAIIRAFENAILAPNTSVKNATVRIYGNNGNYSWIESSFKNMLHEPSINGILFSFKDVTEQKLTNEKTIYLKQLYAFNSQLNRAITQVSNEREFYKKICTLAVEVGKFKAAVISIANSESNELEPIEHFHSKLENTEGLTEEFFQSKDLNLQVLHTGKLVVCNSQKPYSHLTDSIKPISEIDYNSFVIIPLKKSGKVVGTFNLYAAAPNFFTTAIRELLEAATEDLSYALDFIDKQEKINEQLASLQNTEQNLQAIINTTSEGFILTDTNGVIIEFNDKARNTIYQNSNKSLSVGENAIHFLPKSRKQAYFSYWEKVLVGETISFHRSYGESWFNFTISPVYSKKAITGICFSFKEFTETMISESNLRTTSVELKKTLSELNKILDSSLDLICTINSDGEFVNVNRASYTILGYNPDELIGEKFLDFVLDKDVNITFKAFNNILSATSTPGFENRYVHKSGRIVPMLWSVNFDEELGLMFCVAKDITEKKKLEKIIENERDQFYNILSKAPSAIGMLKGVDHVFEMVNPLYLRLTGKKNVIGKKIATVFPEIIEQGFITMLDQVYETGESYAGTEMIVKIDKEGNGEITELYIDFVFQAYRNTEGVIEGVFFFINDTTVQVISKKNIEKSEKQYRQILETAQEGIWLLDENGRTTFVNKKMCEILEYPEEEILGKKNHYFLDTDGKAEASRALKRRKKGIAENIEYTFISKSGKNVLTKVSANPIFDELSNFKGSLGMVSDITEKKHLENLLEKSNRLARIGSWEIDVINGTVYWSDITKEIREADPDFVPDLKTGVSYFTEGEHKKTIMQRVQECKENGTPWDEELQFTTFKGNLKWVRTIGEAVFTNGKCSKIYGSFQDITERKNAAEKVLRSEEKLNAAQRIAEVGSWEVNLVTDEHSWSKEFYRILGINNSVLPSSEVFYTFVYEEDREMTVKIMSEAHIKKEDSSCSFRFLRENGEIGYALSQWRFEIDSSGNPIFVYGILRDLTKEKMAESERLKMIADIVQRNKDLEQFSYIISHNLRSPVANIIGLTEELKDEEHSEDVKTILREALISDAHRLENVIADLNTILQTKTEITERKEEVVLSDLTSNIILSISDLILKENVTITTEFSTVDTFITIKSYMQSIFYNLITNSIKYRQSSINPVISIRSYIDNSKLFLIFKDNGMGIDLVKEGEQIFGLYKRFHSDTEGKGMGLYMVKTQVETLGGKISVSSEVNKGAVFTIEFDYNN